MKLTWQKEGSLYSVKVELSDAVEFETVEAGVGVVDALSEPLVVAVASTGRPGAVVSEGDDADSASVIESVAKVDMDVAKVSGGAVGARTVDLSVSTQAPLA